MRRVLSLLAILAWVSPALAIGVDDAVLEDPSQEALAQRVMAELRCLVCQNQSIVDSDAPLAADLRAIVRTRLAAGDTPEDIKAYLVKRYGDWVLLNPPLKLGTALLWTAPLLALLLGVTGSVMARRQKPIQALSAADVEAADAILGDAE